MSLFDSLISESAVIVEINQFTQEKITPPVDPDPRSSFRSVWNPCLPVQLQREQCCFSLLPKLFKCLLRSLGFKTVLDVRLTPWICKHHGGHTVEFSFDPPYLRPGPDIEQSVSLVSSLRCLTPDAEGRPDIVQVSSMISDVMMKYLDSLSVSQLALEKKLERERRRTQRYFMEANRNAVTCHHELALLSHVSANLSVSS